jgi:hypothetical protein
VREVPDVRFVILGEGELRSSLEDQIKRRISSVTSSSPASAPTCWS